MAVELVNSLESERSFLRTLRKAWNLSDAELVNAKEIAAGRGPVTQMSDNRLELVETYARALRQYQSDMGPAYDFYNEMNAARTKRAEELIAASDDWKDARIGYQLKIRTPARVIRQVMGDTPEAKAVYDAYFAPVIQHDAESVRWERQMRDRLKKAIAGLSHEDSVYIHLKNRSELNPKNDALQKLFAEYTEKNRSKIHFAEADAAMEELIRLTQEIHPEVNEAWVRNGIEPLEFHKRYIPSLTPAKEGKWWNRLLRSFGIETMADELPNDIAGRTENRRPGHQYAAFANEREGVNTEFDAFRAVDMVSNLPFLSGPVGAFFGASNARLPVQSVIPNLSSIFSKSGEARKEAAIKEMAKPIYGILFPFGGTQAKKTVEGVSTMLAGGSYVHDNDGNLKLQFPAYGEKPLDWLRATLFGKYSSKEAQDYIDSGFKGLSAKETAAYNSMRDDAGIPPKDAMEAILSLRGFESDKDGETGLSVKDQQRQALFANEKLTAQQKAGLDRALIVIGEDELPADYTDYTTFMLYRVRDNRRQAAQDALEHGLTIDQFISWDDRLSDLAGETGEDDKRVRSAAEARGMALDEVMQDAALSDSEKQAVADYVLISSMGDEEDKTRKDWEEIARGKVNASDFLRFKTDVSGYEEAYKNTGADNAANVAAILRGYEGLDDGERDVLFQTYSRTMKNNPFHVSEYEQRMQDNGFFGELNADGKAAVRTPCERIRAGGPRGQGPGRELDGKGIYGEGGRYLAGDLYPVPHGAGNERLRRERQLQEHRDRICGEDAAQPDGQPARLPVAERERQGQHEEQPVGLCQSADGITRAACRRRSIRWRTARRQALSGRVKRRPRGPPRTTWGWTSARLRASR